MSRILVINPNSSESVTKAMDAELDVLRFQGGPEIVSVTLAEGPKGIETQRDVESVVIPVANLIAREKADAYVIACFSDPGLFLARETTDKPVVGIAESAFLMASSIGTRFGIVAILDRSIPRHLRAVRSFELEHRIAGDIAINSGVAGLANETDSLKRIVAASERLRDERHADVIILGCAGMGRYRAQIERSVGLPVVDPSQAAVARAMSYVALGYRPAT